MLLVEPRFERTRERGDEAAVLLDPAEQRRDRGRGVHHRGDELGAPVDARRRRLPAGSDRREDESGQFERCGEGCDLAARGDGVRVRRIGTQLANGAQRGRDAPVQLARRLLDLGEGQGLECRIVRGHGVL